MIHIGFFELLILAGIGLVVVVAVVIGAVALLSRSSRDRVEREDRK